jgi:predicted nucleotidyltransferase
MDRETADIVRKFIKRIRAHYTIQKVILFGSRARGDHLKVSDFDFIIVSPDFEGIHFTTRMASIYLYWDEHYDIEPLCYTPEEFEEKKKEIGIVSQAVKEGIEILDS